MSVEGQVEGPVQGMEAPVQGMEAQARPAMEAPKASGREGAEATDSIPADDTADAESNVWSGATWSGACSARAWIV